MVTDDGLPPDHAIPLGVAGGLLSLVAWGEVVVWLWEMMKQ